MDGPSERVLMARLSSVEVLPACVAQGTLTAASDTPPHSPVSTSAAAIVRARRSVAMALTPLAGAQTALALFATPRATAGVYDAL